MPKANNGHGKPFVFPTRKLVFTALMTALTVAATVVLGFRTGDFFFNCGDTVIFLTAALLGPVPAMIAGGLGSFFADMAVYPATMFFTLVIKGAEGLVCGLLMRLLRTGEKGKALSFVTGAASMIVSGAIMMTGYFVCNTFLYGTPASALAALPADAVQATVSVVLSCVLLYAFRLDALRARFDLAGNRRLSAAAYVRLPHKETQDGKDLGAYDSED